MSKQNNVNPDHYKVAGRDYSSDTNNVAAKNARQPQAMNREEGHVPGRDTKRKKNKGGK